MVFLHGRISVIFREILMNPDKEDKQHCDWSIEELQMQKYIIWYMYVSCDHSHHTSSEVWSCYKSDNVQKSLQYISNFVLWKILHTNIWLRQQSWDAPSDSYYSVFFLSIGIHAYFEGICRLCLFPGSFYFFLQERRIVWNLVTLDGSNSKTDRPNPDAPTNLETAAFALLQYYSVFLLETVTNGTFCSWKIVPTVLELV